MPAVGPHTAAPSCHWFTESYTFDSTASLPLRRLIRIMKQTTGVLPRRMASPSSFTTPSVSLIWKFAWSKRTSRPARCRRAAPWRSFVPKSTTTSPASSDDGDPMPCSIIYIYRSAQSCAILQHRCFNTICTTSSKMSNNKIHKQIKLPPSFHSHPFFNWAYSTNFALVRQWRHARKVKHLVTIRFHIMYYIGR
jgi:hypothetical protein